jgi:hypothetical protein
MTTRIILTDDLEPNAKGEVSTLSFTYEGVAYEIDLSEDNQSKLNKLLEPYITVARVVDTGSVRQLPKRQLRRSASDPDPKAIRAWAASHGKEVSPRGRIPIDLVAEFKAAGN